MIERVDRRTVCNAPEISPRARPRHAPTLVLILAIWIGVAEPRRWLRRLAITVLGLVCLQGVIGGMGVELQLPANTAPIIRLTR